MSLDQIITSLPFLKVKDVKVNKVLEIYVESDRKQTCIYCQSGSLRIKHTFIRKLKHISFGDRPSVLFVKSHKFFCHSCRKYFNIRFDGILPYKRATEPFRREVSRKHHDGITQKSLSDRLHISCSTVEKWYQEYVDYANRKISMSHCPKVLGIDEHFFSKKKGYATTLVDLKSAKVFDVCLGRSEASLKDYMNKLQGKENVQVVLMDLSETYRSIVKKYFKNALIVADRFHVIRLTNHHFMNTWKLLDPNGKYNRGLLSLLRRHQWNLTKEQELKLEVYLESVPGLRPLYDFKQQLNKIMLQKSINHPQAIKVIPKFLEMLKELKDSGFESMRKLGATLESWIKEIVRMWRFTKTNSITEGLHNKMEMISRRAFGFRNFNNYRLRVRVHCGYGK